MKINLFKSSRAFAFIISFFLACFQMQAMQKVDEDVPMEGELGRRGMRSITPQKSAHVILSGSNINIEFFENVPSVQITIKDVNNTIIYTKTVASPRYEIISLEGIESGCYTLELSAETGYMHGTFMYVY